MPSKQTGPTRRTPLDGLTPLHFDAKWPNGLVGYPLGLRQQGLTEAQVNVWRNAVKHLQELARRYVRYLAWRETTQQALAKELKVSTNRLSAFRTGKGWPSGPLVAILEHTLPSMEDMDAAAWKQGWRDDRRQREREAQIERDRQLRELLGGE